MKKQIPFVLISFALASAANGAIYTVSESLLPSNTNPDTSATAGTGAMGSFTGSYDSLTGVLDYTMTWSGLSSMITGSAGAHIHGPAPLGSNAGVLHTILGGGTSNGGTSGTQMGSFTFSSNASATEADFLANQWYVNIHTVNNGSGELRSQVNPTLVPEPSVALLSALAMLGLGVRRRR